MRLWLMVVAIFGLFAVVLGTFYSYGVFFSEVRSEFGTVNAVASWLFGVTLVVFSGTGMVGGSAVDRYGARALMLVGMVCFGVGMFLTTRSTNIYQAFAFYSLGVGIGSGCAYVPLLTVIGRAFHKKRALANSIAVSGVGVGTALMSYLIGSLILSYGWRRAYLVVALLGVSLYAVCFVLVTSASARATGAAAAHDAEERNIDWSLFGRLYVSNVISTVIQLMPFIFLAVYAKSLGVGSLSASVLIGVVGVAGLVGRLLLGVISPKFGAVFLFKSSVLVMSFAYAIWFLAGFGVLSFYVLTLFGIVFGVAFGVYIASFPGVLVECFGLRNLGFVMGRSYTAGGVGAVIGLPLLGVMLDFEFGFRTISVLMLMVGILAFLIIKSLASGRK